MALKNRFTKNSRYFQFFLVQLAALAVTRLIREAIFNSTDLHVYWRAAHLWLEGVSPFLFTASDHGDMFKYPPWTIPLFWPLGWMDFELTRWVWVLAELFAIFYSMNWLKRAGVRSLVIYFVAATFWWTWLSHIYSGQFTLFMLLAALWTVPPDPREEVRPGRAAFLAVIISAKVYSVFTLFGIFKTLIKPRTILWGLGSVVLLEFVVFTVLRLHGNTVSVAELHQQWTTAAQSGAAELGAHVVRGQGNHSFTAGVLRAFRVDPLDSSKDNLVAFVFGVVFSGLWFRFASQLPRAERWAGWIAVGMVVHPLLWHHSFVLAFPLCALSLERAVRSGQRSLIFCSGFGMFLIALFIPNIFGMSIVTPFELISGKSWGAVLSAVALVLACKESHVEVAA